MAIANKTTAFIATLAIVLVLSACWLTVTTGQNAGPPTPAPQLNPAPNDKAGEKNAVTSIRITVGDAAFSATLYDNDATKALLTQLPLTLNMGELNGNEKYYYLPEELPAAGERVGSIQAGDLMLYGTDCLVLFYKSFSTAYSYTRLGYMEDAAGLAAALGSGQAEVTFEIIEPGH